MKPSLTIDVETKTGLGAWTYAGSITHLLSATFEFVTDGFYGTASFSIQQGFDDDGLVALQSGVVKRLLFRLNGSVVFFAIVRKPVRRLDQIEVHNVPAIGPVGEMNGTYVDRQYVPPGGEQDLSWFYYQLAKDYILPRGYANQLAISVIGVSRGAITYDGPLRAAITDTGTLADGYIYWGLRLETDGTVTFFVNKRNAAAAPIYEPTVAVADYDLVADTYPAVVRTLEDTGEDNDIVNKLRITGGEVPFPNLFTKNPSFEGVKTGGSASSNMLLNGDFDGSNAGAWSLSGGATIHSQAYAPPHSAPNYLELDTNGEKAIQAAAGVVPGRTYGFNFQIASETPLLGPFTLTSRIKFADAAHTVLQTEVATWTVQSVVWDGRTQLSLAPPGAVYVQVELEGTLTANNPGHGIIVDTAVLFDTGAVYQDGWRIETTSAPLGTDTNADPAGLYLVNWIYEYADPTHVSPGVDYGNYGVMLNAFGLTGGKYVRLINSKDGETQLPELQYYTVAVTARATQQDGSAPVAGNNFKIGVLWFDNAQPPNRHNIVLNTLHLGSTFGIHGATFQLPANAVNVRLYFEALAADIYYLDGVQITQSPTAPTEFQLGSEAHYIIDVRDVYQPTDPEYDSIADAPVGYGPVEEKVSTPIVIKRVDAIRYARTIFDVRALPAHTQVISVIQVDAPVTLFKPDGYLQAEGITGYTFPKLWPARVGYQWTPLGLECDIELGREVPRLDQTIERNRRLAITKVGTGVDVTGTYIPPIYDEFTVGDIAVTLSSSGRPGAVADDVATVELSQWMLLAYSEIFVRGFAIDLANPAVVVLGPDINGEQRQLVITLEVGDAFFTGDKILVYYYTVGSRNYALYHQHTTSPGTGDQTFAITNGLTGGLPLFGSIRAFVRGFATPPSSATILLDTSGQPTLVEIAASEGLLPGDDIDLLYDVDPTNTGVLLFDSRYLAGTETTYTFAPNPRLLADGSYAVIIWLRGMVYRPTITNTAGVVTFPLTGIGAGDHLLVRFTAA